MTRPEAHHETTHHDHEHNNVPINVHGRAEVLLVRLVEVPHAHLPEVPRMELVEQDPVVVETTGVTTTGRMLAVLADATMAGGHVPPLFAVLVQTGRLYNPREPGMTRGKACVWGNTMPRGVGIQKYSQHGDPAGTIRQQPFRQRHRSGRGGPGKRHDGHNGRVALERLHVAVEQQSSSTSLTRCAGDIP